MRKGASNYVARLRRLADTCDYEGRIDEEIRDQFIFTCLSDSLRQKLLRAEDLTLKKLLEISIIKEQSSKQAAEISRKKDSKMKDDEHENVVDTDIAAITRYPRRGKKDFVNHHKPKKSDRRDFVSSSSQNKSYHNGNPDDKSKGCFRCGETFDKGHLEKCKAKMIRSC